MRFRNAKLLVVNGITATRILAASAVIVLGLHNWWWLLLAVAVIVFSTDWLDGQLARRWKVVTGFGKFIDPLSDKTLVLAFLWVIAGVYEFHWLFMSCVAIISAYDIAMTYQRIAHRHSSGYMLGANQLAKYKTAVLMASVVLLLGAIAGFSHSIVSVIFTVSGMGMLLFGTGLTVTSWLGYQKSFAKVGTPTKVIRASSVCRIDMDYWQARGVTCVLFDIEGTLAPWGSNELSPRLVTCVRNFEIPTIGVATNMPARKHRLIKSFGEQLGAASVQFPQRWRQKKPSSYLIERNLRQLNVEPAQTLMVGDKLADVVAARRAGLAGVVWVDRLGFEDYWLDSWLYRPLEPIFKIVVR